MGGGKVVFGRYEMWRGVWCCGGLWVMRWVVMGGGVCFERVCFLFSVLSGSVCLGFYVLF